MRLENITALARVALLNDPSVSSFDTLAFSLKEVKRGALYISKDSSDINEAIELGAYGVIFQKPLQIFDGEVAWLKSSDLDDTLKRLLRHYALEKSLRIYSSDSVTVELAKEIITTANFAVIDDAPFDALSKLYKLENETVVLLSNESKIIDAFVEVNPLDVTAKESIEVVEKTLFETSFIYNNRFYERQLLSPFFIPYLERLLYFLRSELIDFRLRAFKPSKHFQVRFINEHLELKEFGESQKVLIFEPSFEVMREQLLFMQKSSPWAKSIYIIPSYRKKHFNTAENVFTYQLIEDIIAILQSETFHFALICEQNPSMLENARYRRKIEQLTLDI